MAVSRAFLFVNGEIRDAGPLLAQIRPGDLLIAVDGGLRHLFVLGLRPQVLIGDLDSVDADAENRAREAGCLVLRYPPQKDETDLELALVYALQQGCTTLCIAGGLGGRLDHTLGNLYLLAQPALQGCQVRVDDGVDEVFIVRQAVEITGTPRDRVSLLPVSETVTGVRTEGLVYPLRDETLYRERTRGISNVMLAEQARVRIESGLLWCIHSRLGSPQDLSGGEK